MLEPELEAFVPLIELRQAGLFVELADNIFGYKTFS
jgi:hypothetical protein